MDSLLGRYRNLIILMGVLFLQVLGLAVQVKKGGSDNNENTRLIRVWGVGAITPIERGVVWMQNGVSDVWHNYFYLRGVRAENRELKQQIEQMRIEQVRLNEDAAQARRLQTLLAFKEQYISKTVAAQVIGSSGSDLSRVIYIDKGADAGLKRDMAVITADGIVGKVIQVYPSVSQVLLINDQTSGVGVILEKTRLQGVLRGTVNGEVVLERVMSDEQVPVGETVLTSGGDQIFPKGLAVGTVSRVSNGKDLFLNIKIKPAASLSKLEEVLVLVEKQERQATAEETTHQRAADILAARLPSVPDKPVTNAQGASAQGISGPGTTAQETSKAVHGSGTALPNSATKPQGAKLPNSASPKAAGMNAGAGPAKADPDSGTQHLGTQSPTQAKPANATQIRPTSASPNSAQSNPQPPNDGNSPQ